MPEVLPEQVRDLLGRQPASSHGDSPTPSVSPPFVGIEGYDAEIERDALARAEHSRAAYDRVGDLIYPDTLALLSRRNAALHEMDAARYHNDVTAMLEWARSMSVKELGHTERGWELADRQSGGDVWRFWDSGGASAGPREIAQLRALLAQIDSALAKSQDLLSQPAP